MLNRPPVLSGSVIKCAHHEVNRRARLQFESGGQMLDGLLPVAYSGQQRTQRRMSGGGIFLKTNCCFQSGLRFTQISSFLMNQSHQKSSFKIVRLLLEYLLQACPSASVFLRLKIDFGQQLAELVVLRIVLVSYLQEVLAFPCSVG